MQPGPPPCTGDCNHDDRVAINELILGVNIALGIATLDQCQAFDCNGNGRVTVDCLVQAVNKALNGCGASPAELGCLASGGTVTMAMCCAGTHDFPDTCAIGACGCAPNASESVRSCACAVGSCFDGSECVEQ